MAEIYVENFVVSSKSKTSYEKGDMPFMLRVQSITIVIVI